MRVVILGCGPAGLLAAHAVALSGHEPEIYSRKERSHMFGAMYLHQAIPGITRDNPDFMIDIIKVGCREGYAENVYGDPNAPVSWDQFKEGTAPAWSLYDAYTNLWEMYEDRIIPIEVTPHFIQDMMWNGREKIMSSIPLPAICHEHHQFVSQPIWVRHGEVKVEFTRSMNDMMYYNGYTPDGKYNFIGPAWYRYSKIQGFEAWEYNHQVEQAYDLPWAISTGVKPLRTTCDCFPEVLKVGRFGRWKKGVLTHHAFEDALRFMKDFNHAL